MSKATKPQVRLCRATTPRRLDSLPRCRERLSLSSIADMLYDDGQPLGCVCEKCLGEHPKEVAGYLRERVADLCDFIDQAHQCVRWATNGTAVSKGFAGAQNIGMPSPFESNVWMNGRFGSWLTVSWAGLFPVLSAFLSNHSLRWRCG